MRRLLFALPLLAALPLQAETLSAEIGRTGLAATEARLAALPTPSDEERFTLGGVQFLRAVEISFQDRWRAGLTDNTGMIPFLRLPIPPNPSPDAFQPGMIVGLFAKAGDKLAEAGATLNAVPETSSFGAEIALDDLWFDINGNGAREPEEALLRVLATTLSGADTGPADAPPALTVRFDVADAAWLAAYADMLAAFTDLARAYDPTEPIARVLDARKAMAALGPLEGDLILGGTRVPDTFDVLAILLATFDQQPDTARMAGVQTHLLAMIAENRAFWTRVARETDNDREWLPNATQTSVLGLEVPPEAGPRWLAVLDEMEAVLRGQKLIHFWRAGPPAGINLAKLFTDPRPVDLAGWIQGWAVVPYLETGTLASTNTLDAFDQAVQGESMLFALYFN